jgi:ABC-2 type transport system ATP-binding protein
MNEQPSKRRPKAGAPPASAARAATSPVPDTASASPAEGGVAPGTPRKAARKANEKPAALLAEGLEKTYGAVQALEPLDLRIEPGEAVVLVGHNGSGKTTFLRMASGLLEPSSGSVSIAGAEAGSPAARAALSYLSDTPTFYEDLSVWEHLEYTARLHGMTEWEQKAADLLGLLGIYDRADDLPMSFSRGLKQKANLALGLLRPFGILLVDEPFVGLDANGKQALLELLDEAHDEGAALVVATHELEFVSRVRRCLALRNGEVVHDGPADGVDLFELVS